MTESWYGVYYVNKRFIGYDDVPTCARPNYHHIFFCLHCGDVWGRRITCGSDLKPLALKWGVDSRTCSSCGDGTVLSPVQYDYIWGHGDWNRHLTTSLLIYEFNQLLRKHHERNKL